MELVARREADRQGIDRSEKILPQREDRKQREDKERAEERQTAVPLRAFL